MPRRANKAEIILPTHGRDHVFGRKVGRAVEIGGSNQDQRRDGEEPVPNRPAGIDVNETAFCCFGGHGSTSLFQA